MTTLLAVVMGHIDAHGWQVGNGQVWVWVGFMPFIAYHPSLSKVLLQPLLLV
jgi:hypothetical protein